MSSSKTFKAVIKTHHGCRWNFVLEMHRMRLQATAETVGVFAEKLVL